MDGDIAKLVLFYDSVYGDYRCEVDGWMDGWINSRLGMDAYGGIIVRICAKFKGNSLGSF